MIIIENIDGFNDEYTFVIRVLKPHEAKLYRAIRLEALREYPEYFGSKYEEQVKLPKLYFEGIIEERSAKGIMVGGFLKENLIGICGVTFETKILQNAGEIIQMYVKKKYQGNKMGQALVEKIHEQVKQMKTMETLVLGVDKKNFAAISVYSNYGFENNEILQNQDGIQYMSLSV